MFRTLTIAGVALAVAGIAVTALPAQAAVRIEAPSAPPFTTTCSTGQHALVTLPVPDSFVVGSIAETDAVFVPYRFEYLWTGADGTVLLRSEAVAAPGPVPAGAITCTLAPVEYADGTSLSFTVAGVVDHSR